MKLKEDMEIFNFDKVVNKLTINYILRINCKIAALKEHFYVNTRM